MNAVPSVVIIEKPVPRVALPDWHGKVWDLRQTCDTHRQNAFDLRSESKKLRSQTEIATNWQTKQNNDRMENRVQEMIQWRETVYASIRAIEIEFGKLKEEKDLTEAEIEYLQLGFGLVNECLTQRDQRGGADLCTDDAEIELKYELNTLEGLKRAMTEKCMTAWEELNKLDELKLLLQQDLENKDEAIEIDQYNLGMDKHSACISYKPDALRTPNQMVSYECWLEHCKFLKLKVDNELQMAQRIREGLSVPRQRARNDLKAQNEATNFAIRKRIYETQRIKNELDWQRLNMTQDMERLAKEIDSLEKALFYKVNSIKLAESRLEARLYRPSSENCRDQPTIGLEKEVLDLRETKACLQNKIDLAKATYNGLERQLVIIDRELLNKNHALSTDLRCLDLRNRLVTGNRAPPNTETDRNIQLTQMQKEIPPE
ncbi:tektin-B1 [Rhodnius prolixus]|uniref:Tektin n=2 Tax=Rhodnius prolixus TaxID=13249 RepID=R4FQC8_RHOPR